MSIRDTYYQVEAATRHTLQNVRKDRFPNYELQTQATTLRDISNAVYTQYKGMETSYWQTIVTSRGANGITNQMIAIT